MAFVFFHCFNGKANLIDPVLSMRENQQSWPRRILVSNTDDLSFSPNKSCNHVQFDLFNSKEYTGMPVKERKNIRSFVQFTTHIGLTWWKMAYILLQGDSYPMWINSVYQNIYLIFQYLFIKEGIQHFTMFSYFSEPSSNKQ